VVASRAACSATPARIAKVTQFEQDFVIGPRVSTQDCESGVCTDLECK
jgi:hypothetical protein